MKAILAGDSWLMVFPLTSCCRQLRGVAPDLSHLQCYRLIVSPVLSYFLLFCMAYRGPAEEKAIKQLARSAGVAILASAGSKQYASEFAELRHGVFTYVMLEGLAGAADGGTNPDRKITVSELKAYLDEKVPELTEKYRGKPQWPNGQIGGNDFPLVIVR